MAWIYNNQKTVTPGQAWTDNTGITHPASWALWSDAEKEAAGLVFVAPEEVPVFDNRFYWAYDVPRAIEDTPEVDSEGEPLLDAKGEQIITPGLKTNLIKTVKAQANSMLQGTDWMVTRFVEEQIEIPSEVTTYRRAVRAKAAEIEAAILACETIDDIIILHQSTVDTPAVINNWPEQI